MDDDDDDDYDDDDDNNNNNNNNIELSVVFVISVANNGKFTDSGRNGG
jgi:hypothetical protein